MAGTAGAIFEPAKGGHLWVMLRGRRAILPMHGSRGVMLRGRRVILPMHGSREEMKRGTIAAIKKQLGIE